MFTYDTSVCSGVCTRNMTLASETWGGREFIELNVCACCYLMDSASKVSTYSADYMHISLEKCTSDHLLPCIHTWVLSSYQGLYKGNTWILSSYQGLFGQHCSIKLVLQCSRAVLQRPSWSGGAN